MGKTKMKITLAGLVALAIVAAGCGGGNSIDFDSRHEGENSLHDAVCKNPPADSGSEWFMGSLYDCEKKELFIPYQLWTGAEWTGGKNAPCMHDADTEFMVNGTDLTYIDGPIDYYDTHTGMEMKVWSRKKANRDKEQYFTCHEKGIGRVYDRRPGREERYYPPGRCKFPAGYGWEIGVRRQCLATQIEITRISVDEDCNLSGMRFKWWYEDEDGNFVHDHTYVYEPNKGMTTAIKQ